MAIAVSTVGARNPFSALMTNELPELHLWVDDTPIFPMYIYEMVDSDDPEQLFTPEGPRRRSNVTDTALAEYRTLDAEISKEDVFFYVYGILHAGDYRAAFASDLKKSLPRIPRVESKEDFWAFAKAGRQLAELHTGYESVEPHPDVVIELAEGFDADVPGAYHVVKMKHPQVLHLETGRKVDDRSRIIYNEMITISGIPEAAHEYMLGSRSAIAWLIESFRVKTDKKSGITNNPNDWSDEHSDPTYILDLVGRVANVAVQTVEIVDGLPSLDL